MEPAHVLGPLTPDHVQSALETHVTLYGQFLQNYVELTEFERSMQFDARGESADDDVSVSFTEYVRHLQKFVDVHAVLAEYTYTLGSEWFDDEQVERYCEMAVDLGVVPMAAFLSELPTCLIEVGSASLVEAATADGVTRGSGHDAGCLLSRDHLTDWDGWSADARRALAGLDEQVLLSSVVKSYIEALSTLHAHLFGLLEEQLSEAGIDE